jgi:hypothetical protein
MSTKSAVAETLQLSADELPRPAVEVLRLGTFERMTRSYAHRRLEGELPNVVGVAPEGPLLVTHGIRTVARTSSPRAHSRWHGRQATRGRSASWTTRSGGSSPVRHIRPSGSLRCRAVRLFQVARGRGSSR